MAATVQSVERAAAIVQLLAASRRRLSLADVAGSLDLAKGTAHGILRTLVHVGFVEQDRTTGRYQLGNALVRLGSGFLDDNVLRARALNWADALASRTGEAVRIATLHGSSVAVVHHSFRPDDSRQDLDVGTLLPAHATALGKVLLAYSPGVARELVLGEPFTRRSVTTKRELARQLAAVRGAGWAAAVEEMLVGQAAVAAPIRGQGGLMVGAIGIDGPVERLCDARGTPRPRLVAAVADAAQAISRELAEGRR